MNLESLTLAFAGISVAIMIHLHTYRVLVVLGVRSMSNGFSAGSEVFDGDHSLPLDRELYQNMLDLGFEPVGVYWEKILLSPRFEEYVFVRKVERCYGTLMGTDFVAPRVAAFLTVFDDGVVVHTKNYSGGVEINEPGLIAEGAAQIHHRVSSHRPVEWRRLDATPKANVDHDLRLPLVEVLDRHRENVQRLIASGHQPPTVFDAHAYCEAQKRYFQHPALARLHRSAEIPNLAARLIGYSFFPGVLLLEFGIGHLAPWAVLLVEGLVGLYLRHDRQALQQLDAMLQSSDK